MSDNPYRKQDFLEVAKHQLAQISAEFDKTLESFKDSERRKQMTTSYLDMLQKGLSKAQESVAKYQEKIAATTTETRVGCIRSGIGAAPVGHDEHLSRPGRLSRALARRRLARAGCETIPEERTARCGRSER